MGSEEYQQVVNDYWTGVQEDSEEQQKLVDLRREKHNWQKEKALLDERLPELESWKNLQANLEQQIEDLEKRQAELQKSYDAHSDKESNAAKELLTQINTINTEISDKNIEIQAVIINFNVINNLYEKLEAKKPTEDSVKEITRKLQEIDKRQITRRDDANDQLQQSYNDHIKDFDDKIKDYKQGLEKIQTLKESVVDRMVVSVDPTDNMPCLNMNFPIPQSALDQSADDYNGGWLIKKIATLRNKPENSGKTDAQLAQELGCFHDKKKGWMINVKVKPADVQEYLEETNREDKYRGGKKHMMDFFKDPSSMNNIQLMKSLGPGLIAVGLDKGLKTMGKDSGLLYGPGASVVATMVYNEQKTSENQSIGRQPPMPDKKTEPKKYEAELEQRRTNILDKLKRTDEDGGGVSVSMGFSSANGHVNYLLAWGTPSVDGVDISADDIARCRMNLVENAASSSAWNNDRVQEFPINTAAMDRGIGGILKSLKKSGKSKRDPKVKELRALQQTAREASQAMDEIAAKIQTGAPEIKSSEELSQSISRLRNRYFERIKVLTEEKKKELQDKLQAEGKTIEEIEQALTAAKDLLADEAQDAAWAELSRAEKREMNSWSRMAKSPDYTKALNKVRKAAADTSDWLKSNMSLNNGDGLDSSNALIVASNTERDNRVSDNKEDRANVGGGQIGSQKYGSANATDSTYCVPINALASGWNGEIKPDPNDSENALCTATRYNYSDDDRDQFVMLSSFSTMIDKKVI